MKKLLKHGIFALSAALFVTAFLTSCTPPIGELDGRSGSVRLVVNGENSRTIVPGTLVSSFASFKLVFTATAGEALTQGPSNGPLVVTKNYNGNATGLATQTYALVPGTYTLVTTAYMTTGQVGPAAEATNTGILIEEGDTQSVAIELTAYAVDPASGNGTFSWNIDFSGVADLDTATMAIVPLNGGTSTWTTGSEIDLLDNDLFTLPEPTDSNANTLAAPLTLAAGYYEVIFELANDSAVTASFPEVLWVYANMRSSYTHSFTDRDFGIMTVTVTFNSWDYTEDENTVVITKTCTPGLALGIANMPTAPTQTDYTFLGWYTTDGHASGGTLETNWGTQFIGTTTVNGDIDVYARWLKDGELDEISGVTLTTLGGTSIVLYKSTTPNAVAEGDSITVAIGGTLNFTVQNSSIFNDGDSPPNSTIEWKRNSANVATGATLNFAPAATANTINTSTAGVYTIVVRAVTADGEYQSSHFYVTVVGGP